jgi:N-acetylglucosaminyldiphosphoundecaprenol N-acetyl-beta-D-mannosaminyltransferase
VEIFGVPVDCIDMAGALDAVESMIAGGRPQTVLAVNPEKIMKAQTDSLVRESLRGAGLLIPDGIGVVVAVRLLLGRRLERVPGSELMPAICARAAGKAHAVFLYGATPEVNERAAQVLVERYPGLRVAGHRHGYVGEADMPALVEEINASGAQILFVALGSPRQELWMKQYLPQLDVRVCQGVGGTFDVLVGKVRRAPAVFRRLHLEWLYRLLSEPRRLLRQTALPRFAWKVLVARVTGRR